MQIAKNLESRNRPRINLLHKKRDKYYATYPHNTGRYYLAVNSPTYVQ